MPHSVIRAPQDVPRRMAGVLREMRYGKCQMAAAKCTLQCARRIASAVICGTRNARCAVLGGNRIAASGSRIPSRAWP